MLFKLSGRSFLICLQAMVAGESQNGTVVFIISPAGLIFIIECACQMMAGNVPKSWYGKQPQCLQQTLGWISPAQYWYWQQSYTHFILNVYILSDFIFFTEFINFWCIIIMMNACSTWATCWLYHVYSLQAS